MPHVIGENRNQFFMLNFEEAVPKDSFVRAIDAFVDAIDLESFGFTHVKCNDEGRPAYHPSVLMKLYLYGYRYGIRSSRKLEREAALNMEAIPKKPGQVVAYIVPVAQIQNHCRFPQKQCEGFPPGFPCLCKTPARHGAY